MDELKLSLSSDPRFDANTDGVYFYKDATFAGNVNIEGTLNAVNRTEVNIEDNTIVLNTNFEGVPVADAGITVVRGDYTNATNSRLAPDGTDTPQKCDQACRTDNSCEIWKFIPSILYW